MGSEGGRKEDFTELLKAVWVVRLGNESTNLRSIISYIRSAGLNSLLILVISIFYRFIKIIQPTPDGYII